MKHVRKVGMFCLVSLGLTSFAQVVESGKALPLAHDADVVIVGGSTAAVTAAEKAAQSGAKVFLVAPRPFLGEDMAGRLNVRTEAGDDTRSPLYRKIFAAAGAPRSLPFTYRSDRRADRSHADPDNQVLCDGKMSAPENESVQFGSDVGYIIDLGSVQAVDRFMTYVYSRPGPSGFLTDAMAVQSSSDNQKWEAIGETKQQGDCGVAGLVHFTVSVKKSARYFKVTLKKSPDVSRQLLAEFCVIPTGESKTEQMVSETTPFRIKRNLDETLIKAGVPFLTGAFATEILTDEKGALSGVVIASRSGRQAIKAKTVIDATERGLIARAAGAKAAPFPAGTYTFKRTIFSGQAPAKADNLKVTEQLGIYNAKVTGVKAPKGMSSVVTGRMYVCEMQLPMKDASVRAFAEAEQAARDLTFTPTQLDASDMLQFTPPDFFYGKSSSTHPWESAEAVDLGVFQPAGTENLFVLSALADVARTTAEVMTKPGHFMAVGARVGAAAAQVAQARGAIGDVKVAGSVQGVTSSATVGENVQNLPSYLSNASGSVQSGPRALPTLAECDVVVVGAGTGGAPAGISAARQGVKTIVCEYLYQMGGVQTEGLIGIYYFGNRVGFTAEIDAGVAQMGSVLAQTKSEWYRRENRKAGAEIWYGTLVTGVVVENNQLTGVIVVTPMGERGVIKCKVAIDGTGNADLAAMAGEETEFVNDKEVAVQGVGQTIRAFGSSYANNDVSFVDDTDAADLCFFSLRARMSMLMNAWDQSQIVNSRERRRLHGVFYMTPMDVMNSRTYPDVVVRSYSNFDSHGHTVCEQFFIDDPGHKGMFVNLPYRCLLPKRIDGLLVIGLGISAHRDAMPILRMQPDVQNQGYAVGVAAALSLRDHVTVRNVNMRELQKHLIEKKIIPEEVLTMKDSFPLPDAQFVDAVATLTNNYAGLSVLLTDVARSIPLLKTAFKQAKKPDDQLKYAHVLAMIGDATGEDLLIAKVQSMPWDKGWNFRGMGQFNRSVSWVDSYIIALARAKSKKALPVLLEKARQLDATREFSHFRAIAMALEGVGDQQAAKVLADVLAKPEIAGHAVSMHQAATAFPVFTSYQDKAGNEERTGVLRELAIARALYRVGDYEGKGEATLRAYAADPRGMYANHAKLVLQKK